MEQKEFQRIQELMHKHLKVDGASLDLAIECFQLGMEMAKNEEQVVVDDKKQIWDTKKEELIDMPQEIQDFLDDIQLVYEKHGLCISHEDGHGSFLIEKNDPIIVDWLLQANKNF